MLSNEESLHTCASSTVHRNSADEKKSSLSLYGASQFSFMRQADQQLLIHDKMRRNKRDVEAYIAKGTKALEKLSNLESRINRLKKDEVKRVAKREVDTEIKALSNKSISFLYKRCMQCGNKVLKRLFSIHSQTCEKIRNRNENITFQCLMKPQPPRNVRVQNIGHNAVELIWDDPYLDGGDIIFDYELSFVQLNYHQVGKRKVLKDKIKHKEVALSAWCKSRPVSTSFRLINLQASSIYGNFQVRCCNRIGWSPFSSPMEGTIQTLGKAKNCKSNITTEES